MNEFQFICFREQDGVAHITLERPPLNVMNTAMMREMHEAVEAAERSSRFILFSGAGEKGFSAGADVADHIPERVAQMLGAFHAVFRALWNGDAITIAAVHGCCLGGGCELAAFCDFVVAEDTAEFGQPEIKLGCFPPVALAIFPMLMGLRSAADLILTGRTISAEEARELGIVSRVVPAGQLENGTGSLLAELKHLSDRVLTMTKKTLWQSSGFDLESVLDQIEQVYLHDLMKTNDAIEGVRAFLEKRAPVWQGK